VRSPSARGFHEPGRAIGKTTFRNVTARTGQGTVGRRKTRIEKKLPAQLDASVTCGGYAATRMAENTTAMARIHVLHLFEIGSMLDWTQYY
jgi:predicted flavoprotein YhiN